MPIDRLDEVPTWVQWVAAMLTGILGWIGAERAKDRVVQWSRPRPDHREMVKSMGKLTASLDALERTIREEQRATRELIRTDGSATRAAVHGETDKVESILQPLSTNVALLLRDHERK